MMTEDQHDLVDFINQEIDKWDDERRYVRVLEIALAALTQPASPALKLPDEKPHREGSDDTALSQVYELGIADGFNRCLREVAKLNAPHTAPIEPICATGGAEWVKLEDELPKDGSWCIAIEEGDFAGDVVYWGNGEWRSEFGRDEYTHWMYHPAAPES